MHLDTVPAISYVGKITLVYLRFKDIHQSWCFSGDTTMGAKHLLCYTTLTVLQMGVSHHFTGHWP